jgi:glucan phosphoethanolaminetransferase (alkaline phosphatase superfamily)
MIFRKLHLLLQVYPYSVFHIFFEQYLNTHRDAALLVGLPLLAVFGAAWLFTGSLWGSTILLAMLVSLMLQLAGSMYLSGIEVNAGEVHFRFLVDAAEVEPDKLSLAPLGSSRAVCGAVLSCWRCLSV